jgi:Glycosyltransferase family 9 (heptosyltransferase)
LRALRASEKRRRMNEHSPPVSVEALCAAALKSYGCDDATTARLARLVLRQQPDHGLASALLAMTLIRGGRDRAAALDYARRALAAAPNLLLSHCAMGVASRDLGLLAEAIGHLRNAVKLDPNHREVLRQLGLALLQAGTWREGWSYYERRPTTEYPNGYQKPDPPGVPEWRGEDLTGRTLAVLGENGHGDQIQFLRFIGGLLELPLQQLLICVRPGLVRLVEHSLHHYPGGERATLVRGGTARGIHYRVATESLPHRFGANEATLPGRIPYLFAPPSGAQRPAGGGVRVGLVWRGERRLVTDAVRSTALNDWASLVRAHPEIRWLSLQHDDYDAEEKEAVAQLRLATPLRKEFDFLDTASVIDEVDLVISVDTAVAHLAGAMGKPVWLLNRASSEWRWGWKRTQSPWYPTMRIFNQETLFDWRPALEEVDAALVPFCERLASCFKA